MRGLEARFGCLRRTAIAAFASAATGLFAAEALAGDPKFQGVGEAWLGHSDNIQSSPEQPLPGRAPKSGGAFALLRPGVVMAMASQQAVHRLGYTFTWELLLGSLSASTASNQVLYRGFFDLSPRLTLVLDAGAVQSNRYSSIILAAPGAGAVDAVPPGSGSFLSATAGEVLSYDLAEGWRTYEGAGVAEQTPLFETVAPRTFLAGGRVGVERSWDVDALGLEARADYTVVTGSLRVDGTPAGVQRQIVGTGAGIWRHDWGRYFTSRIEAGALRVERLNSNQGFWSPEGSAALDYVTESADAGILYSHGVTTNMLLGQTILVDEVRLRGAVPLAPKNEVLLAASVGYQKGRILDENANLAAHVDALLCDVGLGWQATEIVLLGVRYQFINQDSDVRAPPLPLSYARHTVMAGVSLRFPPDKDMPRAYRAPRRVDRVDEIRDTVQPTDTRSRPGGPGT